MFYPDLAETQPGRWTRFGYREAENGATGTKIVEQVSSAEPGTRNTVRQFGNFGGLGLVIVSSATCLNRQHSPFIICQRLAN